MFIALPFLGVTINVVMDNLHVYKQTTGGFDHFTHIMGSSWGVHMMVPIMMILVWPSELNNDFLIVLI